MNKNEWSMVDSGEVVSPYQLVSRETLQQAEHEKHAHEDHSISNLVRQTEYGTDSFQLNDSIDEPESFEEVFLSGSEIGDDEVEQAEGRDDDYESSDLEGHDELEDPEYVDAFQPEYISYEGYGVEQGLETEEREEELIGLDMESYEDSESTGGDLDLELEQGMMDEPEAELENEYFENLLTSQTETADFRILFTESDPPGKTIYINTDLKIGGADKVTGIFVPKSFKSSDHFEIIIYLHGYKYDTSKGPKHCYRGICTTTNAEAYWKNEMFPLREGLNLASRNSILVVPTLGYQSNSGTLIYERGVDLFLNHVLRALVCEKAIEPCHTIGKIILAAHSGGGSPMLRIAAHKDKFSKLVKECWAFDALYGGTSEWVRWINANPERKFYSYYLGKTPTYVSESIRKQCKRLQPNAIKLSAIKHHWDLVKPYWNERLITSNHEQKLIDDEALDEYDLGHLSVNEFEDSFFNYESTTGLKNVEPLDPSSKFHSSRLSSEGNADLDAFKRKVYEAHVRWAQSSLDKSGNKRRFVGNVPDDDLKKWDNNEDVVFSLEKGKKIFKSVVVHKRMVEPLKQLLAAARQKAAAENKNVRIYLSSGYRSASTQFSSWDSNFRKYYNRAISEGVIQKNDYSLQAIQALSEFIRAKLGAPGYSNHQHGRAMDFFLLEENSSGKMEAYKVDTTKENVKRYQTTWFLKWLNDNAHLYGFKPYVAEPWHWEYWGDLGQPVPAASSGTGSKIPDAPAPAGSTDAVPKSVTTVLGWLRGPLFVANVHAKNIDNALRIAYQGGNIRDENLLTNLIFFSRHQNIAWRALRKDETGLVREWLRIRDTEVRPWISAHKDLAVTTSTSGTVAVPNAPLPSAGSTSVNVTPATYQGMRGVKVSSTTRPQKSNVKTPDDKIIVCVSSVEGGFDTVNMYDKGIISWGIMQWTVHAGSLQKMMQYVKKRLQEQGMPYLWTLFGGLELTASGNLQYKGIAYKIEDPNLPLIRLFRGSDDVNLVHYDPVVATYWARIFALAGRNPLFQQFQMEYIRMEIPRALSSVLSRDLLRLKAYKKFSKYIDLTAATAAPYERKIADYVSFNLKSKMLFFGMWTNNPSWAKIKLFDAIKSFQKLVGGTGNPSSWKTGWERAFADEFEKVLRATTVGYWGDAKSAKAGRKSRTEKMMKVFEGL